jgi:hypothetical protein
MICHCCPQSMSVLSWNYSNPEDGATPREEHFAPRPADVRRRPAVSAHRFQLVDHP